MKAFFAAHPLPSADRTLQQALERIEVSVALKAHQSPALKAWLSPRTGQN